jgi:hypothetical protein
VGFQVIDHVIRGEIRTASAHYLPDPLRNNDVHKRYNAWASSEPNRLKRDAQRWKYWEWVLRLCEPCGAGYICIEGGACREAVMDRRLDEWPVPPGTTWTGLKSVTGRIGVPLLGEVQELILMAKGTSNPPELFMTDQF